jgi:hypothetical protein
VVRYRQEKFLPRYQDLLSRTAQFDKGGKILGEESLPDGQREVILHYHDESIFYGNDRRKLRRTHSLESCKPYAKGEGQSVMIVDFVSATIGWLASPDGTERARVHIRPGKARDGYFSSEEVMNQLNTAMDILERFYPQYKHVFIFDNARTHTKRAECALSARSMPKKPHPTFGANCVVRDDHGKPIVDPQGRPLTERRRMEDATFQDGARQPLYFPQNHTRYPGFFKGMTAILRERGFEDPEKIRAACPGFKCDKEAINCCQRRILFDEKDFTNVPSLVESHCQTRGFEVLFLPKFHPELNMIEMCWGYAKRLYRELPPTQKMDEIERNALHSPDNVPLDSMRR